MLLIENFPSMLVALPKSVSRSITLAPISGWWVSASITSPVMLPALDANKNVDCIAKIKVRVIFIITMRFMPANTAAPTHLNSE